MALPLIRALGRTGAPSRLVAWLVPLLLLGTFALARGPVLTDDTDAYALWADRLIATGFDYPLLVRQYGSGLSLTYALFVTLIAGLKLLFGAGWMGALITVNVVSLATAALLLVRLVQRTTGCGLASWFALGTFLLCFDLWQWAPYALSDSTFLLLAFSVFAMEARRLREKTGRWAPVFAASIAASLYRPTGFLMVGVTSWSFFLARSSGRRISRPALIAAIVVMLLSGAMLWGWIMQNPARWPISFAAQEIAGIAEGYHKGQIVWDRPEGYHTPPRKLPEFWAITLDRLMQFGAPAASNYSLNHIVIQLFVYFPVYALALYFIVMLARGRTRFSDAQRDVFYAAIGAIAAYAIFHALVQVDYDWRYRIPVLPHFILLASGGLTVLISAHSSLATKLMRWK